MAILPSLVIYLAAYTKDKKEPENTFTCCTYNCFWDREKTYNAVSLVVNTAILIVRITLWQLDQPTSLYWLKNCFEIVHSLVCIVKFVAENEEQPMVVPSIVVEPPPPPPKFHCNTSTRYSAARSTSRPRSSSEAAGAVEISDGSKIIFTADVPGPESLVGKKDMAKVVSRVDASEKEVALNPVRILRNEAEEERAETARLSSFVGVIAVGDLVKSTLGPKGMYKILVAHGRSAGQVEITNGGSTIVKAIGVDNPAAKILVDMSRVQDDEVGDGTTSAIVLAAELLREAEKLIEQKIHPQIIIAGWRRASHIALASLEKASVDNSGDPEKFHKDLLNIARTTLSSKILSQNKEYFANLAVEAVLRLKGSGDLSAIQVIKKLGGCMEDSFLDDGFLLDKKPGLHQPKRIEKARILIANTAMDTDKIKVFGSRVCVDAVSKIAELELAEKEKMKDKVNKIVNHNINVFINRQLIYNYPEQLFADAGVMAIEHAGFAGIERLALVTGGGIVSTFDHPEMAKLGHCDLVEEVMIGQDTLLRFGGVPLGEACTVVIRGATQQILDEAERSLHDAFCVLAATVRETRTVYGGGCSEMLMANVINDEAARIPGKEAMAMEAFSRALRQLPTAIADNAGYDSAQLVSELRAAHSKGENTTGLDMEQGMVGCMKDLGITESFVVKRQVLLSASEAAEMILRVDNIIKAAPRRRGPDNRPC
ncbi:T-complex protein 1 subunit beta-like [Cloeon dipterum]|uniref:T-complex protein 1 subunit beta-like n=1 Tax=Cloeon dipterum TaxID=197152 RepID=UPI00321FE836